VVYTDGEGDAPVTAQVVIDGVPHEMTGQGTDYRLGVTYTFSTTLSSGEHEYHFTFGDGVHGARLPANGSTVESVVDELQRIVVLASHAEDGVVSEVDIVTLGFDDTDVPAGLVTSLSWTSDLDGALGTGNEASFSLSAGTHSLTLTVTTSSGGELSQTITMVSLAAMPEPVVDQVTVTPEVPTEGDVVAIDVRVLNEGDAPAGPQDVELRDAASDVLASASTVDALEPGASTTVTLTWTAVEGTHSLTVVVGGDEYSLPLLVEENFAPIIDASIEGDGTTFPEGEAVRFSVEVTDVENDQVTYLWDFGDGATSNETSPTHKYTKPDRYTVTVTVTDARGAGTTDTLEVEVTESATPGLAAFTILLVVLVSALVAIVLRRR
jgi:PKD repeat protein